MIVKILVYTIIIILSGVVVLLLLSNMNFTKSRYQTLVDERLDENTQNNELIDEEDLEHLPFQVRNFLQYVGVLGTKKVYSYTAYMTGEFKMNEQQEFRNIKAYQTSYQKDYTRLFYMEMNMMGLKITGLHHFVDDTAVMEIKFFDLFRVVNESGDIMNISETVTILNDMCLFAPQTLIDPNITWIELDDYSVEATFTKGENTVKAILYFNEEYQLINFVSNDRYAIIDGTAENIQWSTPLTEYHTVDGLNLPFKGSAIWNFDDREFEYIRLEIKSIQYNKNMS